MFQLNLIFLGPTETLLPSHLDGVYICCEGMILQKQPTIAESSLLAPQLALKLLVAQSSYNY